MSEKRVRADRGKITKDRRDVRNTSQPPVTKTRRLFRDINLKHRISDGGVREASSLSFHVGGVLSEVMLDAVLPTTRLESRGFGSRGTSKESVTPRAVQNMLFANRGLQLGKPSTVPPSAHASHPQTAPSNAS